MLRGRRLAVLSLILMVILAAAAYVWARRPHAPPAGPYAAVIERLHEINHQMRDIHHNYKAQHEGEDAFKRWHDLLHEEKELLHRLPEVLESATPAEPSQHRER